jgi:hypothetical protein
VVLCACRNEEVQGPCSADYPVEWNGENKVVVRTETFHQGFTPSDPSNPSHPQPKKRRCILVLCSNSSDENYDNEVFDRLFVPPFGSARDDATRDKVMLAMNEILGGDKDDEVVIAFDEAQHLMENGGAVFGLIRRWLRLKYRETRVVALFSRAHPPVLRAFTAMSVQIQVLQD